MHKEFLNAQYLVFNLMKRKFKIWSFKKMIATILEEGIKGKNSYFQFTVIILQGKKIYAIKPLINDSLQW